MHTKHVVIAAMALLGIQEAMAQSIPPDPAVRTGKLSNGFTYYIRHNETPRNRVQFYLVNKVGSVVEDEDQRGLAHFLEHMNFNGTTHFPKNELISKLQKAGVQFGADVNAHTTFDYTTYELPVSTDDPAIVELAVQIMRDWAQEATLDPAEIEKERGIILEEERLGKGAGERMARRYFTMLLNGSRYADRLPIGLDSILINFQRPAIKRFRSDWYRPDLQALIVVGDIDVQRMEQMVKKQFGSLKNPKPARERIAYHVPLTGKDQFLVVTDKEATATELQVYFKHKAAEIRTEADYMLLMKRALFNQMMNTRRFNELSRERNPALVSAGMQIEPLLGGLDVFRFTVTARDGQLQKAFEQGWSVLERVRRYGFSQYELDRAKQQYLRRLEVSLNENDKTPSLNFVKEYQDHFLEGEAAPGIAWEYRFAKEKVPAITLKDINALTTEYLRDTDRDVLLMAPEKDKASLPARTTVMEWIGNMQGIRLDPFKEDTTTHVLISDLPKSGTTVSSSDIPEVGVKTITLSNGLKVILKPTTFKNDEIRFRAFAPGGTSVYDDNDYDAAASAVSIISSFGVGKLSPVELTSAMNGKVAEAVPYISARTQGIQGSSSVQDLETALQLIYLRFTQPRKDSVMYDNIITRSRAVLPNRYADPGNIFNDTMAYVMGNYSYRNSPPTLEKIDKISLQRSFDIYKERFADAANFTFVFTGSFDADGIQPLLEQYLGSLPATNRKETATDRGIHLPAGQVVKTVHAGTADKALVRLVISGDYPFSQENNQILNSLSQVLQIRLLQTLRESAGEVYSPSVQFQYNKLPGNRYAFIVAFGCAPENVDHLIGLVKKEMEAMRNTPVAAENIEKIKASTLRNTELALKDNAFWLSYLSGQLENDEPLLNVLNAQKVLDAITPGSLHEAARLYLTEKNVIQFVLLPE